MMGFIERFIFALEQANFYIFVWLFIMFLLGLKISSIFNNNEKNCSNDKNECEKFFEESINQFKNNINNLLNEINWRDFKIDIKEIDSNHYILSLTKDQKHYILFEIFLDFKRNMVLVTQIKKIKNNDLSFIDFDVTSTNSLKVIKILIQKVVDKYSILLR